MCGNSNSHGIENSHTVRVQTMEGHIPRANVASELAAMFKFAILPTLRRHYYKPGTPGPAEPFRTQCQTFAAEAVLPAAERHRVTFPAYISVDWDTRHTWMRQFLAMPGGSLAAMTACDDDTFAHHLPASTSTRRAAPAADAPAAENLLLSLSQEGRDVHVRKMARLHHQTQVNTTREEYRRNFLADAKVDIVHRGRLEKSLNNHAFITILAQQVMPLSKISPDIHSPVEHMVGTIKRFVTARLVEGNLSDASLRHGRTYQQLIDEAVLQKGSGDAGQHHVRKSVQKQEIICRILAAETGETFDVDYEFAERKPGDKKQTRHTVRGTAGQWIRNRKWT